ncbi:MAG: TRAP transporter small permease [Aquamicrobium sp.]|uniref:TRAP transporter small permease subunit n=2 Tax=Aquamicrobium sp. TaxID=1872579 RepID=UPI00349EC3C4|nr:TRAP transporter small permease [Aquamicrobium sp.]
MRTYLSRVNDAMSAIGGWLMLLMMGTLVVDVIWRSFFTPIFGMAELSVFVMMIVVYLSFSRSEEYDEHVRLELLLDATSGRARAALLLAVRLLALLTVAIMFYAVTINAWAAVRNREAMEGIVSLPIWPVKIIMVIGMTFFLVQTALNLFGAPKSEKPDPVSTDEVF